MTDLINRLKASLDSSCTCNARSGEAHAEQCPFRIMTEAIELITTMRMDAATAHRTKSQISKEELDILVHRFLAWPLPDNLCCDTCVIDPTYRYQRTGTNLLDADQAREMILYLLDAGPQSYVCPAEIQALFLNESTKHQGRARAMEWAGSLVLKDGDTVWLPETGWLTKTLPEEERNSP